MVQLRDRWGRMKPVQRFDPLWDTMDGARYRLSNVEADGMIELCTDDGRALPDLRQPTQVVAY